MYIIHTYRYFLANIMYISFIELPKKIPTLPENSLEFSQIFLKIVKLPKNFDIS